MIAIQAHLAGQPADMTEISRMSYDVRDLGNWVRRLPRYLVRGPVAWSSSSLSIGNAKADMS